VNAEMQEMEGIVLDSVDKFLESEVRPYAHRLEQAD
jgi:hypothetical protein